MNKLYLTKILLISSLASILCACSGFFDKDNTPTPTPLSNFKAEAQPRLIWEKHVNSGIGNDYLKMVPAVSDVAIFTADKNGYVTATQKNNGATLWHQATNVALSAGPCVHDGLVFVASRNGEVIALNQAQGNIVWKKRVTTEVLAPPAANNGVLLVKTINGEVTAFASHDGHPLWHYQQTEPALILRGGSAPQLTMNSAIVGFANGNLAKLDLQEGNLHWQQTIAIATGTFAIQRMVDIDADPYVFNNKVYAATYQGKIASLDINNGKELWTHDISSYTGLTVDADKVFVADAASHLWAFDAASGTVSWRQNQLAARNISGPATLGNMVVVGDAEGYLHWLSKADGHFMARTHLGGGGILAAPLVDNNLMYVLTKDGHLAAYSLS
jgi:outer membrane protein assembly factor BamB